MTRFVSFALVFAVLTLANVAAAQDDDQARLLYQRGEVAYAEGRYEIALALFEESYELSHRPQLLFNLANTLERLGRLADAVARLEAYLPNSPQANRASLERRIASLRSREAERVRALEQAERERRELESLQDEEARRIEEEARRAEQRDAERQQIGTGVGAGVDPNAPPTAEQGSGFPWGTIGIYAAALVAAGVGTGFAIATDEARRSAANHCVGLESGWLCEQSAAGSLDQSNTFALIADVAFSAAGVLAIAGTVWLLVELLGGPSTPNEGEESDEGEPSEQARLRLGPGGLMVTF